MTRRLRHPRSLLPLPHPRRPIHPPTHPHRNIAADEAVEALRGRHDASTQSQRPPDTKCSVHQQPTRPNFLRQGFLDSLIQHMHQHEEDHPSIPFIHGATLIHAPPAMATEMRLNQVIKGAPLPSLSPPPPAPLPLAAAPSASSSNKYTPLDPHLSSLPSSPPQIYLNLLILESSLRAQYLHLLSRRRLNTFFILLLIVWNTTFTYFLFLAPREDGTGRGGSVYWFVETSEKIALLGGLLTGLLLWATGQWERGIRWPRRWLGTTNRGLRGFNLRVVVVRGKWWRAMGGHMAFLLPFGLWREAGGSDWHLIEHESPTGVHSIVEEDLAPGGDHIMLLLLPKSFSPEFRENWEEYRAEYWEGENGRRRALRRRVKVQMRVRAKEAGGWAWWTGLWRITYHHSHHRRQHDPEKHPQKHQHANQAEKDALAKAARRRSLMRSDSSHSRQSSRSSTPHMADFDGGVGFAERTRRGSSSSVRRKKREGGTNSQRNSLAFSPLTAVDGLGGGSRPSTPGSEAGSVREKQLG